MSNISRATLPQEFFDITSADLLVQPEPQYLHALLAKSALDADLNATQVGLQIPGRDFPTAGAAYADVDAGRLSLSDPLLSAAIKVQNDFNSAEMVGHTIRINRPKYTESTYTQASRRVPVGSTISQSPISVESEQVAMTIDRFAGPYDNTAGAVRPYGIERFDATRGVHSMAAVREHYFKRDFDKWLDRVVVDLFDQAATVIYPTGMTAANDSTAVGDFPFSLDQIRRTRTSMDAANIPVFADGMRMMILTPLQQEQLEADPEYQRQARYTPEFNPIFVKTYIKSVSNFHLFKSTTLLTTANSSSIPIQYGQAFGPGMVGMGAQGMPRVVPSTEDMFGERILAIWLWYAAFQVLDNRFGRSVRSS
jgi:hypothetical protein